MRDVEIHILPKVMRPAKPIPQKALAKMRNSHDGANEPRKMPAKKLIDAAM
jgi:hypothetical protein